MGFCTGCGTALRDGDAYCGKCGRAVASAPLVRASTPTARPLPSLEGASSGSRDGDEFAADRSLAERAAVPLEPGTPRALRFEGHMLAAGLLMVGFGGMHIAPTVALAALGRDVTPASWASAVFVGGWAIVEGLGLRGLQGWARVLLAIHAIGNVALLLFRAEPLRAGADFAGTAIGVGLPFVMMTTAFSAPPRTFTRAYRDDPARLNGPRATPYRSPFFWIACAIAAGGYGMVAYALAG